MCNIFQTGALKFTSQKSWLVAASKNKITSAKNPNGWNGTPATEPVSGLEAKMLRIGLRLPPAW